jgi:hypothetical protein
VKLTAGLTSFLRKYKIRHAAGADATNGTASVAILIGIKLLAQIFGSIILERFAEFVLCLRTPVGNAGFIDVKITTARSAAKRRFTSHKSR